MSRQNPDRAIPHLRDIFGLQRQMQDVQLTTDDHEDLPPSKPPTTKEKSKKKQRSSGRDHNARTLTERDVKHLERHLSMKKTIRKKMMRDLQQAFVEDPSEFICPDHISPEKLKAEISADSLTFGSPPSSEPNFLDMLRGNGNCNATAATTPGARLANHHDGDDPDIYESEAQANKKTSFWRRLTTKGRNKR